MSTATEFYTHELVPLLTAVKGPIGAFVLEKTRNLHARDHAIETGEIMPGTFRGVAIFDDTYDGVAQKGIRYRAKTGSEILGILAGDASHEPALMAARLHAKQELNHAVVVEAARKLNQPYVALTPRHEAMYSRELDRAQTELYPVPDKAIISMILGEATRRLHGVELNQLPDDQRAFMGQFNAEYAHILGQTEVVEVPKLPQEKVDALHNELRKRFQPALTKVRSIIGENITQDDMAEAMNLFLKEIGMPMAKHAEDTKGWRCVQDLNMVGYGVRPAKRRMYAGRFVRTSWVRFEELALHEGVVHVMRAENGSKTGVPALQTGLPANSAFEEGLALLFEHLWRGKVTEDFGREDYRYISVSYAEGHIDAPHTETETLRFTSGLMTGIDIARGMTDSVKRHLRYNRRLAFNQAERAFRGMPLGHVMRSNLSYKAGKLDAIDYLSKLSASPAEVIDYLLQGKFHPLKEDHTSLLEALNLTARIA